MIDINLIRNDPDLMKEKLAKKEYAVDFTTLLYQDKKRRELIHATEQLKAEKNKVSAQIPQMKKEGRDCTALFAKIKEDSEQIKQNDEQISLLDADIETFMAALPNLPADDVLPGGKENNKVIRTFGEKPQFDFAFKHHVDIVENLGIIDYTRGVKTRRKRILDLPWPGSSPGMGASELFHGRAPEGRL